MLEGIIEALSEFKMCLYIDQLEDESALNHIGILDRIISDLKNAQVVEYERDKLGGSIVAYCHPEDVVYTTQEFMSLSNEKKAVCIIAAYINSYSHKIDNEDILKLAMELFKIDHIISLDDIPKNNAYTQGLIYGNYAKAERNIKLQVDSIIKISILHEKCVIYKTLGDGEKISSINFKIVFSNLYYNTEEKRALTGEEEKEFIENTEVLECLNDSITR